jgi:hypothetical protein
MMLKGNENMSAAKKIWYRQSGIALLTTILLMLLMSSLLVGFFLLINSGQKLSGINNDYAQAFYGAEAGMEKLTADLSTLFSNNYAPPIGQINALQNNPPVITDASGNPVVSYVTATGGPGSGYTITSPNPTDANGNYLPTVTQISSGAYQGLTALATPYVLSVTARTPGGSEVKLQRTTQTVGIPLFQFGIFCQTDCAFYAGSPFSFGGRTHSNGNLFLASGTGASLTMNAPVSAFKDVITYNLENGNLVSNNYTGTVNVFNGSGTTVLTSSEGSLVHGLGSAQNPNWPAISTGSAAGDYAGNLRNGLTGALQLNLGIVTLGNGATQSIDVIRRPPSAAEPLVVTQERYYGQASLRILLSDNPVDITSLPCISAAAPYNLADLNATVTGLADPITAQIQANLITHNETFVPLAASGATGGLTYSPADGYWIPAGTQSITGWIKIEIQKPPYNNCNTWQDVTAEVLGFGYVGKNANPTSTVVSPALPALPTGQIGSLTASTAGADACPDGHPLAIIRLERIRDNPSTAPANTCGTTKVGVVTTINTTTATDFWPNVLYDVREGLLNFNDPPGTKIGVGATAVAYNSMVALGGVMQYIEVDAKNLAQYLSGTLGGSGHSSYDPNNAPNDYVLYISDRRGNYYNGAAFAGGWPPLSPSTHETGEYGFSDFANPSDANGCPNKALDIGEDLDSTGISYSYGEFPNHTMDTVGNGGYSPLANLYGGSPGSPTANAFAPPPYAGTGANNCGVTDAANPYKFGATGAPIWPGTFVIHANEARENPNFFFRRAVKIVNGVDLVDNLNQCPGGVTCGLTIAAENPIYIQGSYNCNGCNAKPPFTTADVGASVIGDAVTLLSDNWNDVNSFTGPPVANSTPNLYVLTNRAPLAGYYRTAIVGGKGVYFTSPGTAGEPADWGTDGGAHNFLRYLENWGGNFTLNYEGSLVSLYFNRQGIGVYKSAGNVYAVPPRNYAFDNNFLTPSLLPPRTPLFRDVNTTGFTQLLSPTQ